MKYKLIIDRNAEEEIVATVRSKSALTDAIENLVNSYTGEDNVTVRSGDEVILLKYSDIECITLIDRKLYAVDGNGEKHRISGTLSDVEKNLPSYFVRINKSAIANENSVLKFKTVYNGAVDVLFKCGYKEYVSRRCFSEIKRRLLGK